MTNFKSSKDFFENMYQCNNDPWSFATKNYELQRYDAIFNALSSKRYNRIFEPGCSIGILTEKLATIANQVNAFDISETAAELAKERCHHLKNVLIKCSSLTRELPLPNTDLIVLSEIGYYFSKEKLEDILQRLLMSQKDNLIILACHWTGHSEDHLLSADQVHETIDQIPNLLKEFHLSCPDFRIDRWRLK
jgi:SAM-dependent methyltransferase